MGRMPWNRQLGDADLVIHCILHQFLLITCVTSVSLGCHIPGPHVHQKAQAERRKKSWQGAGAMLCSQTLATGFLFYPRTLKSALNIFVSPGINSLTFKSFTGLKTHLENREILGGRCRNGLHGTRGRRQRSPAGLNAMDEAVQMCSLCFYPHEPFHVIATLCCASQGNLQPMPHLDFQIIQAVQKSQWLCDSL